MSVHTAYGHKGLIFQKRNPVFHPLQSPYYKQLLFHCRVLFIHFRMSGLQDFPYIHLFYPVGYFCSSMLFVFIVFLCIAHAVATEYPDISIGVVKHY